MKILVRAGHDLNYVHHGCLLFTTDDYSQLLAMIHHNYVCVEDVTSISNMVNMTRCSNNEPKVANGLTKGCQAAGLAASQLGTDHSVMIRGDAKLMLMIVSDGS